MSLPNGTIKAVNSATVSLNNANVGAVRAENAFVQAPTQANLNKLNKAINTLQRAKKIAEAANANMLRN